jgi:integrase
VVRVSRATRAPSRFGGWVVSAIEVEDIAKLIRELEDEGLHALDPSRPKRGLGRSSIDNYLKPLQQVLEHAVRRKLISSNPCDLLVADDRPSPEKRQSHTWSEAELAALLAGAETVAKQPKSRHDYTLLLRVAATLGLRLGEILGLTWADFDREAGLLHVRQQWLRTGEYGPPKTPAAVRTLEVPNDLKDARIEYKLASKHSSDESPIFTSRAGTPLSHRNVTRRGFEAARDKADLSEELTFHDLRHAAASRLIHSRRLTVVQIAKRLGHADATVTLKMYAHEFASTEGGEADDVRAAFSGVGGAS